MDLISLRKPLPDGRSIHLVEDPDGRLTYLATDTDYPLDHLLRQQIQEHQCYHPNECCMYPVQQALRGDKVTEMSEYDIASSHGHMQRIVDGPAGTQVLRLTHFSRVKPGMATSSCFEQPLCATHELLAEYVKLKAEQGEPVMDPLPAQNQEDTIAGIPLEALAAIITGTMGFGGGRVTVVRIGRGFGPPPFPGTDTPVH